MLRVEAIPDLKESTAKKTKKTSHRWREAEWNHELRYDRVLTDTPTGIKFTAEKGFAMMICGFINTPEVQAAVQRYNTYKSVTITFV